MKTKPAYKLEDLILACHGGIDKVYVTQGAMITAKTDFGLDTQERVLQFIATGGLEKPKFAHSDLWMNNPNPGVPIKEDEYDFFSGLKYGYLAFLDPKKGRWMIKSLKLNTKPDPRNLVFKSALTDLKKKIDKS